MDNRTQKHSSVLRIPRRDWKSYTVDNIREVIAFYLGVTIKSKPMKDILTEKAKMNWLLLGGKRNGSRMETK
jgi:hypothetical protein